MTDRYQSKVRFLTQKATLQMAIQNSVSEWVKWKTDLLWHSFYILMYFYKNMSVSTEEN